MTTDELFQQATTAHATGDSSLAERLACDVLTLDAHHANAHSLLGLLRIQTNDLTSALSYFSRAAELQPRVAGHRSNLGETFYRLGDSTKAETEFRTALTLAPNRPETHFGLGNALKDQCRTAEALAAFNRAIELNPRFARALYNRGNLRREEGRVAEAERDYRSALAVEPTMTDALVNLGAALGELHRWAEAEQCFRQALNARPNDQDLHSSLAGAVLAQGRTEEAATLLASREDETSDPVVARFHRETLLPPIAESPTASHANRDRVIAVLERARRQPPKLDLTRLHHSGLEPSMMWAYQADDVRPILEAYSAIYLQQIEPLELRPTRNHLPRIGVVVTHGHEGVYDRCLGRQVERIAERKQVQVTLVCSPAGVNVLRHLRPSFPGDYLAIPSRIDEAAVRIRDAGFDLLHYWEVGTDATNYFLPYFKPARVQCVTWGWPVTSSNPRMDWYVSSALLEPDGAESHYRERLARLPSLPTCYERPPTPPTSASVTTRRKAFGVDAATPVYLCVQNLRKVHPDFDALLCLLLEKDPRGRVVLVADEQPGITELLLTRLRSVLGANARRIGVVGRQDRANYLRLVSSADVLLDTLHYSSGANTVADAVACGTPLVTLPGRFHRGRWANAVLRHAGVGELVVNSAEEYVSMAVQIATDEALRTKLTERLRAFGQSWFDDSQPAVELEAFWLEQVG